MKVSVIVPVYNSEHTLAACLQACLAQSLGDYEIIVVDDGSTDDSARLARQFPVRVVSQPNAGPAAARNRGAAMAAGERLAFTDADCVPREDWLCQLAGAFAPGVVATGGTYDIANEAALLARLIHAEILARHKRFSGEVDFLGSFNVMYDAAAFHEAGGFDTRFKQASGEDNDLAYRLQDRGGKLLFVPEAAVAHHHPERLWRYLLTQMRHGYWRVFLYRLHPRRARGDAYAGPLDLLAPPATLLMIAALPAMAVAAHLQGHVLSWGLAMLGIVSIVLLMHVPLGRKVFPGGLSCEWLAFCAMATLRDLFRAAGLCHGMLRFHMLNWRKAAS
ncbi:MAG: glycosyltransferase [Candidatus Hydrogenedentes bacterium]|nr:glycosyltransferase [Candidatus Hydrogenedentota bacterium]